MSHYDEWGKLVLTFLIVSIITMPLWIIPWAIWYAINGRNENVDLSKDIPKIKTVKITESKKPWTEKQQNEYTNKLMGK